MKRSTPGLPTFDDGADTDASVPAQAAAPSPFNSFVPPVDRDQFPAQHSDVVPVTTTVPAPILPGAPIVPPAPAHPTIIARVLTALHIPHAVGPVQHAPYDPKQHTAPTVSAKP